MNSFCGSPFWDNELTWNTNSPDFTTCFQETALVWVPCAFLWLLSPLDLLLTSYNKTKHIPWTLLTISKIGISVLLSILAFVDMSYALLHYSNGRLVNPSDYYASFIKAVSFILVIALLINNRLKGICTSGVLFLFWLLLCIGEIITYRSALLKVFDHDEPYSRTTDTISFIVISCSLPLVFGQVILFCFADTKPTVYEDVNQRKKSPEDSASFLSKITFWWFNSMAVLGYKQPLVQGDMWNLSLKNTSNYIVETFDKAWIPLCTKALKKTEPPSGNKSDPHHKKTDDQPPSASKSDSHHKKTDDQEKNLERKLNIMIPLMKTFWWEFTLAGLARAFGSLLMFVSPVILDKLITFVGSDEPVWKGFFYAAVLFFAAMGESVFNSQFEYRVFRLAMRIRSAVTATLYRKVLALSSTARRNYTVGEIVNLMSVDVQRIMDLVQLMHWAWTIPLVVSIALYMLYQKIGVSVFAGVAFLILLFPINGFVTYKMRNLQLTVMKEKDKRTKLMNEVLNGIKILKLYGWEESFEERVEHYRHLEVKSMETQAYYYAISIFCFSSAAVMVAICTFTMYILIDPANVLDANKAFVSISLFNILRGPFGFLPMLVSYAALAMVSIKRIDVFLSGGELNPENINYEKDNVDSVRIENGTFTWDENEEPLLKNINLNFPIGSLTAIVGNVGSGKTSLLSALLGDMDKVSGSINISGKMAYVPQQAWIQNATLRKNIIFTDPYKEHRYNKVLKVCSLKPDLEMLPGGDMTEIGEKGINLSGGQKQRVSLARAVYNNAEIYLLDDPLSAVDSHVSKDLFDHVIGPNGMLKGKTRILVSHRINVLPEVDKIVVLKDGEITEIGSYEELLHRKGAFADFLVHHLTQQGDTEDMSMNDLQMIEDIANKVGSAELLRQVSILSGESESALSDVDKEGVMRRRFSRQMSIKERLSITSQRSKDSLTPKTKESMPTKSDKSRLTEAEFADVGSVKLSVYLEYAKSCGLANTIIVVLGFLGHYVFNVGTNIWLSEWSNDSLSPQKLNDTALRNTRLGVYGALGAGDALGILIAGVFLTLSTLQGARLIHNKSLSHILKAPMSFFDTTPLGRILNRFSKDVDAMDNIIRNNLLMFFVTIFGAIASFVAMCLQSAFFVLVLLPVMLVYYMVQKFYVASSRQLKRLESISRSPIYTHFSETISGTSSIRAYGANQYFVQDFLNTVDANATSFFPSIAATRWLAIRLEFLGYTISLLAAIFAVMNRGTLSAGLAGLSISYALRITMTLNMLVRAVADLETNIVSVERCLEYTRTPTEAPRKRDDFKSPVGWPSAGAIQFENYSTRYREGLDLILKNISCQINSCEKVGIVGRTGAGKSSLTLCLFRLIESAAGRIVIDGVDIANLGLYDLRSKLTIIPQDPVLFMGSLRMNLDPFSDHCDEEVWTALEQCHLKAYVDTLKEGLEYAIVEGGENLSVGQRQLLCLGRALLRKTKVLIMDEATAAVDMETDELIQATIRSEFKDCTVLTIAHRLNTVMDYDRIIVLSNGEIAEFDSPSNLLQNHSSIFYSMARDAELVS